jgi:decaprenylphospho-beta-D-erythro-pentofuranosid-2-ulose 2-reductase
MALPWSRAIVVGASSGIGEEIAKQLAAGGCRVALVARREGEMRRIAENIGGGPGFVSPSITSSTPPANPASEALALTYTHDVTCAEEVPALFQQICRDLGGLDVIFYAAGVMPRIAPDEYSFEKDRLNVEVNFLGAVAWLNEAATRFGRAGEGTIVGISSVAGDRGRGGYPVYGATKAALNAYLESLRNRVGRLGVSVVTVKPGPVQTPMTEGMGQMPLMITPQEAARGIIAAARARRNVAYVPWVWRPIMAVIRAIPSVVFQRMKKLNS